MDWLNRIFRRDRIYAEVSQHRDLFPGALEVMILQTLRAKPMHDMPLPSTSRTAPMICCKSKKGLSIQPCSAC